MLIALAFIQTATILLIFLLRNHYKNLDDEFCRHRAQLRVKTTELSTAIDHLAEQIVSNRNKIDQRTLELHTKFNDIVLEKTLLQNEVEYYRQKEEKLKRFDLEVD